MTTPPEDAPFLFGDDMPPTMKTKITCQAPPFPRRPTRMNPMGALDLTGGVP
ncbi:hypothetical protein K737_300009 [Holospora undulata HU1]|uniref:Uncharacterized protein n=1 Tax=Holospora undulata HU1 TaxID=1321371 RepID=A0A061JIR2_9PROT|nr:hypothetical protein K737_300009 [Holospora undulata HU1]